MTEIAVRFDDISLTLPEAHLGTFYMHHVPRNGDSVSIGDRGYEVIGVYWELDLEEGKPQKVSIVVQKA